MTEGVDGEAVPPNDVSDDGRRNVVNRKYRETDRHELFDEYNVTMAVTTATSSRQNSITKSYLQEKSAKIDSAVRSTLVLVLEQRLRRRQGFTHPSTANRPS